MTGRTTLRREHVALLDRMQAARVAVLLGDVAVARDHLSALARAQRLHVAVEEAQWLPRLPATARWPARVYLAEHRKLEALLEALQALLAAEPAPVAPERRLYLLDRMAPFLHVLEHHAEREEKGLFVEVNVPD